MSPRFLAPFIAIASLLAAPALAQEDAAKSYPSKPIHFIVGFVPGAGTDVIVRVVSAKMFEGQGPAVIVGNKPGAQSIIAAEFVAKSAPDGYTVFAGPVGPIAMNPALYSKLPYDPLRDFAPVTLIGSQPVLLVVNPAHPARSVKELLDFARARPKDISYASGAPPFQLASELLKQKTGTQFTYIPYKGSNESLNAILSGQVTISLLDAVTVTGPLKAGRLRALALMSPARHPAWPDVPTIAEAGVPDIEVTLWTGVFVAAATPAPIVRKLRDEIARVVALPEVRDRLAGVGFQVSGNSSEEFGRFVASEHAKWTAVAKKANIRAD
ncbi:MAG: tripartite tricarboxylate transporter substrate binding protein [Betaproteobacteria bacterium]|nr:tripartite tricarboxylate transporter substrate binding protein [Betaproteobacteria bacterium]